MLKRDYLYAIVFLLSMIVFSTCASTNRNAHSSKINALFLEAKRDFEAGRLDSAEAKVKELLKVNPNLACTYDLLGGIYRKKGGLRNRLASVRQIRRAIELEPLNPVYHYSLGLTYLEQDFEWYDRKEFKKAAELDSNYIEPWLRIGDIYKQRGIIYDEERYYRRAVEFYEQALKRDSSNGEALYGIAMIFLQEKKYDKTTATLDKIKEGKFNPKQVYLLRAYLGHRTKDYRKADEYYGRAFDLMPLEERKTYEDVELLLSEEQKKEYAQLDEEKKTKFNERFWTSIDPDPSTEINERKLEHYSRIVYSDINFSVPSLKVRGCASDRGRMCIKFGEPDFRQYEMWDFVRIGETTKVIPSKWHWFYSNRGNSFSLTFENAFQNYNFVIPYEESSTSLTIASLSAITPQIYDFDYGGELLKCLYQVYQFEGEEGKTNLDVVYAIPNSELKFTSFGKFSQAIIDEKYIATNLDGQRIEGDITKKGFLVPTAQTANSNLLSTDLFSFNLPSGDYQLVWSLRDSSSKKIAVLKIPLEVDDFASDSLGLSSIILADKIEADSKGDFVREGYSISPNFNHTFYAHQGLQLYYEVHNLKKDWEGKTYYRSECAVVSLKKGRRGETERTRIVSQSFERRGMNTDEVETFSLSFMDAEPGEYELVVRITDLNKRISKERRCEFRLIREK